MIEFIQQVINGVALGSVLALFALGFSLVIANLGVFNVAHEGVFAWGAIVCYLVTSSLGLPFPIAVVLALSASAVINVIVYLVLVRPLEHRPNRELATFVSCLGGLLILGNLASLTLDRRTVRLPEGVFPKETWDVLGLTVSSIQVLMLAVALGAFGLLYWLIERTQLGRAVRATAYDKEAAALQGVDTRATSMIVFAMSGALAGLGAVLVAVAFNLVSAEIAASYFVMGLAIMVLGGFGNVSGTLVAGVIVGIVAALTAAYVSSAYRDVVVFGMLMATMVLRPHGLFTRRAVVTRA